MTQLVIDLIGTNDTPKKNMAAIDANFDELYAAIAALNTARAFAYLTAAAATTIVTAGTFLNIAGAFTNDPMVGFSIVGDKLTYDAGSVDQEFEIDWGASFSADAIRSTVHIGVSINGAVLSTTGRSARGTFCKNINQEYAVSGSLVAVVKAGETVELQITSDGAGEVITVSHFGATIRRFV